VIAIHVRRSEGQKSTATECRFTEGAESHDANSSREAPWRLAKLTVGRHQRQLRERQQNITFALKSCILSGSSVTCHLALTNNGDDRDITLKGCENPNTKISDQSGRDSDVNYEKLGCRDGENRSISGTLVAEVPTPADLCFDKVSSDISSIELLEIASKVGDKDLKVSSAGFLSL
jgi:hypothetical protein